MFTVHEQFFSPAHCRIGADLVWLQRLLRQRFVSALALLLGGLMIHPLMAFGGMMIWAGMLASSLLPWRVFLVVLIATVLGGVTILSLPALAIPMFGLMDDDWHHMIRVAVGYNYPDDWRAIDWVNLVLSLALPIVGCVYLFPGDDVRRRFLLVANMAGAVGVVTTIAASMLPYALLFQGQPYRVLWILKVLQVPLAFVLIGRWSQAPGIFTRVAALGLAAFFCISHYTELELAIFAAGLALSLSANSMGDLRTGWWYAGLRGLVFGSFGWMLYRWRFFYLEREVMMRHFDLNEWVMIDLVTPVFWLVALVVAAWIWQSSAGFGGLRWTLSASRSLCRSLSSPLKRRRHFGATTPVWAAIWHSCMTLSWSSPLEKCLPAAISIFTVLTAVPI